MQLPFYHPKQKMSKMVIAKVFELQVFWVENGLEFKKWKFKMP